MEYSGQPPVSCSTAPGLPGGSARPVLQYRAAVSQTICLGVTVPDAMRAAVQASGCWTKHDFKVKSLIGKSSSVWVYKATCNYTMHPVALKCYRKDKLSRINYRQVEREVQIQMGLQHPHVLALYGAFEDESFIYLVQELCKGGDLFQRVLGKGPGKLSEARYVEFVLKPFLEALLYLHSHGIIHRDIKPENLLFGPNGALKVADFGLSLCWLEERPVSRVGTLDYMSPEVLQCPYKSHPDENKEHEHLAYHASIDTWALGVLTYEILTGQPPFQASEKAEKKRLILAGTPTYPDKLSPHAADFIHRTLQKDPNQRASIVQLLNHPLILVHCQASSVPRSPSAGDARGLGLLEPSLGSLHAASSEDCTVPRTRSELRSGVSNVATLASEGSAPVPEMFELQAAASCGAGDISVPGSPAYGDHGAMHRVTSSPHFACPQSTPPRAFSNLSRSSKVTTGVLGGGAAAAAPGGLEMIHASRTQPGCGADACMMPAADVEQLYVHHQSGGTSGQPKGFLAVDPDGLMDEGSVVEQPSSTASYGAALQGYTAAAHLPPGR